MSLIRTVVDADNALSRQFSALETAQLPFAAMQAVNKTAWEVRQEWSRQALKVFDRPTSMTQRAVLYTKASKGKLYAEIFIRDEAFKGAAPAKYLQAQVTGGQRRYKRMEQRLSYAGVLPPGMYAVPGKSTPLDMYGNVPGRVITAVLSAVSAQHDPLQNASPASRKRRSKKKRGGQYFAISERHGRLRPGVYERIDTGFGSAVRSILMFVNGVRYQPRYPVFDFAQKSFDANFGFFFERELEKAVASARGRAA